MENKLLKSLINKTTNDNFYQTTTTTPISQEDLNKVASAPVQLKPFNGPQQGWQCPVCGAVMSPWSSVCINCHGNWHYTPKVTFDDNWQVTYGSDQASCEQTITTTTSHN